MIFEKYKERLYKKLAGLPQRYARYMYIPVGELEDAEFLETKEHFRSVPDVGWNKLCGTHDWGGEWNNLWVRGSFTVPENLDGKKLYAMPYTGAV